jgi:S1-C subfamily serine protease
LKAGDVLIEIDGQSLQQDGSRKPYEKLLAFMRDVEPDQKLKVRYLRDGKAATATVVARRADRLTLAPLARDLHHLPAIEFLRSPRGFGSAELVALTPKLGQYFGTDRGLLVVRAPNDARLQLEEGDVILDIDGRVPRNVSHALQILGSYRPGEKLKMTVMRMKKRLTIEITIPEDAGGRGEGVRCRGVRSNRRPTRFDGRPGRARWSCRRT